MSPPNVRIWWHHIEMLNPEILGVLDGTVVLKTRAPHHEYDGECIQCDHHVSIWLQMPVKEFVQGMSW
jgi:hypothetical protein